MLMTCSKDRTATRVASTFTSIADSALIALDSLTDRATNLVNPSIRLGVTGLSRAGKTVFISSLVHNLLHGDCFSDDSI